jgi:XTP/dITP diphosphohydrolase
MSLPALDSPLVLASHNPGKLRELQVLLAPLGVTVVSASDAAVPEPEETETSFRGNATLKATHAAGITGKPALADDSGISVPALDGAPGIYSARWAGENKDFTVAMQRVHDALQAKGLSPEGQQAYFTCALTLAWPNGALLEVEGRVDGTLTFPPRGEQGFGYDPIFIPKGSALTYGEIDREEKERSSHRARAFATLMQALKPVVSGATA